MLILLSPAKGQNFDRWQCNVQSTEPRLLNKSKDLVETMRSYSAADLMSLKSVSEKIGALTAERFDSFRTPFTENNSKPAAYAFSGDVYKGLDIEKFNDEDLEYAQDHLRILSGLYGLLRPLDLIQPYRLEMGTRVKTSIGSDLYDYWGTQIFEQIIDDLETSGDEIIVNLASNEYFKAVSMNRDTVTVNTPVFKDWKNGQYKIISFFAKNARGVMARWMIKNRIDQPSDLEGFREEGYEYSRDLSTEAGPVFLRG